MDKDRLAAFTDGVMAVIITIMVLELKPPHEANLGALAAVIPTFLSYLFSFVYVAIYWNNHHHFFTLVERVDGAILWANVNLLFWISLLPFTTAWLGEHPFDAAPAATYGVSLLMAALSWWVMQETIIRGHRSNDRLAQALGADLKGKLTPLVYVAGIGAAFLSTLISDACYLLVALVWLIPDRRIERAVQGGPPKDRRQGSGPAASTNPETGA